MALNQRETVRERIRQRQRQREKERKKEREIPNYGGQTCSVTHR